MYGRYAYGEVCARDFQRGARVCVCVAGVSCGPRDAGFPLFMGVLWLGVHLRVARDDDDCCGRFQGNRR